MKTSLSNTFGIRSFGFTGMSYINEIIKFKDQGLPITSTGAIVQRDELRNLSLVMSNARKSDVNAVLAQNAPINVPFSFSDSRSAEMAALADEAQDVLGPLRIAHVNHTMGLKKNVIAGFNASAKGIDFNAGIAPDVSYNNTSTIGGGKYAYEMDS